MAQTDYQAARRSNHKRTARIESNSTKRELHALKNEFRKGIK